MLPIFSFSYKKNTNLFHIQVRDCVGKNSSKVLTGAVSLLVQIQLKEESIDFDAPKFPTHQSRMEINGTQQVNVVNIY